jgi:hypothetical protein
MAKSYWFMLTNPDRLSLLQLHKHANTLLIDQHVYLRFGNSIQPLINSILQRVKHDGLS